MAANITLTDSSLPLRLVNAEDSELWDAIPAEEALATGAVVRLVPSSTNAGYLTNAKATTNAEARAIGMVRKSVGANGAPTLVRRGLVDGFTLTNLAYGAPVYLSDTDGVISDTPGTVNRKIGEVVPVYNGKVGVAPDKVLSVNFSLLVEPIENANIGNTLNTGDATSDNCIDALRDALVALGLVVDV